jgi:MFS family permease
LFSIIPNVSFFNLILIRIFLVLSGVAFSAPFHAWALELVPSEHRYIVLSFGYALGSQILGAPTSAISLWVYRETQILSSIGWYWIFLAMLGVISLKLSLKLKTKTQLQTALA